MHARYEGKKDDDEEEEEEDFTQRHRWVSLSLLGRGSLEGVLCTMSGAEAEL